MHRAIELWRDCKSKVKHKYFTPYKCNRSWLFAHCLAEVDEDQWPVLVEYWSSKDVKASVDLLYLLYSSIELLCFWDFDGYDCREIVNARADLFLSFVCN
ncbi:hypothetical protein ACH5RR_029466 [Cinchona calisaya]|uniref:Uncharacterized protein n=1 Tax=Cinchona calisaya TaxID=153742 RepID=A0ABD2YRQ8_9GENT